MLRVSSPSIISDALDYLRLHEGVVDHMYLDVVGLVTIGIGCMLPTPESGNDIGLLVRSTGIPATKQEILRDWSGVKSQRPGFVAGTYKVYTLTYLPPSAVDAEASKRIVAFVASLRLRFPGFYAFPRLAQLGLVDMVYSLGVAGLVKKYPKFCAAVDRFDWAAAADECTRAHVSKSRNAVLAAMFAIAKG